ncbi:MAG: methyltransferase domain-containing protein [Marivibrio sp.]|uniref:methyltransferase domain-containing protein n=1 Tax=Marivibrio sp. TaxID=2039719 RepID=UPI0032EFAFB5
MKPKALEYLVCPSCKKELTLEEAVYDGHGKDIVEGRLHCAEQGVSFPILNGVPVFLEEFKEMDRTQKAFGNQWKLHSKGFFEKGKIFGRDEQKCLGHIEEYYGLSAERGDGNGKVFLDAGCGLAPYAKTFAKYFPGAESFGVDMSESVMHVDSEGLENLHLVRCDLRNPPFREGFADVGWSYGVLHHTPDTEDAFQRLAKIIKSDGQLYIWVYSKHNTKYSFLIRSLLVAPYRFPLKVNYVLSYLFAVPVWLVYRAHYLVRSLNKDVRPKLKKHGYLNIATGIHDSLVPEYQNYHWVDEVKGWFKAAGFETVEVVGDIGVVGARKR